VPLHRVVQTPHCYYARPGRTLLRRQLEFRVPGEYSI